MKRKTELKERENHQNKSNNQSNIPGTEHPKIEH
jgi:hypothetical protein